LILKSPNEHPLMLSLQKTRYQFTLGAPP